MGASTERIAIEVTSSADTRALQSAATAATALGKAALGAQKDLETAATSGVAAAEALTDADARRLRQMGLLEVAARREDATRQAAAERQLRRSASLEAAAHAEDARRTAALREAARVQQEATEAVARNSSAVEANISVTGRAHGAWRTAANASAILTNAAVTNTGSMASLAVAAGNVAQGLALVSTSARVAAGASGVGALAVVLGLVIGLFERAGQKAEELRRKGLEAIADIARGGSLETAAAKAGELFTGDPFAKIAGREKDESQGAFLARTEGIQGLRRRIADLRKAVSEGTSLQGAMTETAIRANAEIITLTKVLDDRTKTYLVAKGVLDTAVEKEAAMAEQASKRIREKLGIKDDKADERLMAQLEGATRPNERAQDQLRVRAADLEEELTRITLENAAKRAGGERALLEQRAEYQYASRVADIANLEAGEEEKTRLMALAAQERADALGAIGDDARSREYAAEQRQTDRLIAEYERAQAALERTSQAAVDAAIKSQESLGSILTKAALAPIVRKLEAIAVEQAIDALADAAFFNFVGAARHAAVATAAIAAAQKVAQIGGLTSGGGGSGAGGGAGTFTPKNSAEGGGDVVTIVNFVDPTSGEVVRSVEERINRNRVLGKPSRVAVPIGSAPSISYGF